MIASQPADARPDAPALQDARSAYVHVPFCARRCGYCDFALVARREELIGDYLRALEIELARLETPREVDTLFFGGGTPTHLPVERLEHLLALVRRWLPRVEGAEVSVEANPADLDEAKVALLAEAGVNRVSLGAQSFDAAALAVLERDHRPGDVLRAVARLRPRIANVSLDLIFGVPGQSLGSWRQTLRQAIELAPAHVSTYGLTFEKGTAFWTRWQKGALARVPEELEREMYAAAMDDLEAAGFAQYEISSFARPGGRCRHNQVYWRGLPFYGYGPGAARYLDGVRALNHRSVTTWLRRVLAGRSPIAETERLGDEDRAREAIALGLRTCDGIVRREFARQTGFSLDALAGPALAAHRAAGLVEDDGERVRLSREGRFLADSVVGDVL